MYMRVKWSGINNMNLLNLVSPGICWIWSFFFVICVRNILKISIILIEYAQQMSIVQKACPENSLKVQNIIKKHNHWLMGTAVPPSIWLCHTSFLSILPFARYVSLYLPRHFFDRSSRLPGMLVYICLIIFLTWNPSFAFVYLLITSYRTVTLLPNDQQHVDIKVKLVVSREQVSSKIYW